MLDNRFYQPFESKEKHSGQQRKELDRWSDEGGSQTEIVNPDPDSSSSPARNGSDTNRPGRQSQTQQSSKSHK